MPMKNPQKKPLILRRAYRSHILWERRICMVAALVFAALAYLESWVGLAALAGTFLCVLVMMVLWALSDWVEWEWPWVVICILVLAVLLDVRAQVWVSLPGLRDLAVLLSPMVIFAMLIAAGAVHRRRLNQVSGGIIVMLLLVMGVFTLCWMKCANQRFDRNPPEIREGQVFSWHREVRYKGAMEHYAEVTYPDALGRPMTVSLLVPRSKYETLEAGEPVTLTLYEGAFSVPWLTGTFDE